MARHSCALLVIVFACVEVFGQTPNNPPQKPGWDLVFDDEFDSDSFQNGENLWQSGYPWGQTLLGELEYYTRYDKNFATACAKGGLNHIFNGSTLQILAKQEPGNYEVWHWDSSGNFSTTCDPYNYTSGMLWSNVRFLYGWFEIRCKIPNQGRVMWPAFWLWGAEDNSSYREIDAFEFGEEQTANKVGMNIHLAQALDNGYSDANSTSDGLNHFPDAYVITQPPNVSADFHTYAVQWSPNSVKWYVDNQLVRTVLGHVPPKDMHLIVDLAIAPWWPPNDPNNPASTVSFPSTYQIDYIRAYRSQSPEFLWQWGNGGASKLDLWNMARSDQYIAGRFDGGDRDELLAVSTTGYAHLMKFANGAWTTPWANNGNGAIHWFQLHPGDKFITSDFDGDGRDELLAISTTGFAHLMKFTGGTWTTLWANNGSGTIHWWHLNPSDKFVAGDLDGDGRAELAGVSTGGFAHLMKFAGGTWSTPWANNGNGKIDWWSIGAGDRFRIADFDGDGRAELLGISTTGYAHLMKYANGTWSTPWANNGSGKINYWIMANSDQYVAGRFGGAGDARLMAVAANGWSHLMTFGGAAWQTPWSNDGAGRIHLWYMKPTDQYLGGDFDGDGKTDLLAISTNGWAHLIRYAMTDPPLHRMTHQQAVVAVGHRSRPPMPFRKNARMH